jgi:DNA-binding transcriptional LysR family regulator
MFEKLLSKRGLSFDRLRVVVELDEAGSLVKAAAGDPNRQSQYSRQLSQLEDFFGVELTRRNGKNLALTDAGKRLAEIARENLVALEHYQTEQNNAPVQVKVGAGESLLQWFLFPNLPALGKRLPNVQLHFRNLRTKEISDCLCDLTLDLGLIRDSGISPKLRSVRVHQLSYSLFAPRNAVPENRKNDYRWVLENVPLAFQDGEGEFHKRTMHSLQKERIRPRFQIGCESFPEMCRVVQMGFHAAMLPSIAARDLPIESILKLEPPFLRNQNRTVCLAWNRRIQCVRPGFDRIITCFKEVLGGA